MLGDSVAETQPHQINMLDKTYHPTPGSILTIGQVADVVLTQHFHLSEFLFIGSHPDNLPDAQIVANIMFGCATILEPARKDILCAIRINSGYRNPEYNAAVGGVEHSQHMQGCAADIMPVNPSTFSRLVQVLKVNPFVDQLLTARSGWLHVSWCPSGIPRHDYRPNYYK